MFARKVLILCILGIYWSIVFQEPAESNNNHSLAAQAAQEKKAAVRTTLSCPGLATITEILLLLQELLVNLNYSDPQDAESELRAWGNVNQAYEAEDIIYHVGPRVPRQPQRLKPHLQPPPAKPGPPVSSSYKVKFGQDIYYCKPYQPFHTQLRYNFSGQSSLRSTV